MRCKVCDGQYHHCTNCDSGGIQWEADGYCSGDCYYEWSQAEIERLRGESGYWERIARQQTAEIERLTRENEQLYDDVRSLEDCRDRLSELGEYCGCDHVMSPDERMLQVQHIREAFDERDDKIERLTCRAENAESVINSINGLRDKAYEEIKRERDECRRLLREASRDPVRVTEGGVRCRGATVKGLGPGRLWTRPASWGSAVWSQV